MDYSPWSCKESDTTEVTWHARTQGVQTSLHLSHSQQMIPRLDKKYHTEKIQIVTSFKDSLEELTRFTHRCIVAMVYWSGRLQSTVNIGNKHMG